MKWIFSFYNYVVFMTMFHQIFFYGIFYQFFLNSLKMNVIYCINIIQNYLFN